jgi:hypothetical protein
LPIPTSCASWTRRPSTMRSISKYSSRTWAIFSTVCSRRRSPRESPNAREGVCHVEAVGVRSAGKDHRRRAALSWYGGVEDVRQGKYFELEVAATSTDKARSMASRLRTSCWRIRLSRVTELRLAEDLTKQPVVATTAEHPKDVRHRRRGWGPAA